MSDNLTYYIDKNGEENFLDENGTPIFKPGDCGEFEEITLPPLHTWDGKGFIPTGSKGGGNYATPVCPCGWGPNGTPPSHGGNYLTTYPAYTIAPFQPELSPNTHPGCGTWHDNPWGIPMDPCWVMYLQMPFCVNQENGVASVAAAVTIDTALPGAECRTAYDLIAMTDAQRLVIWSNTGNHNAGNAWVPCFVMEPVLWPPVNGVTQSVPDPTGVSPNLGNYYTVEMRWYKIDKFGALLGNTCSGGRMACPQTCHGCTATTSTNCASNPGACEEYNPAASYLFYYPESAPQPVTTANGNVWQGGVEMVKCCISGCTTPGDPNYDPLATCNDGTCANPPSWYCASPGNCQDPGTGLGLYSTLAACNTACPPPPPSWYCASPGNCQDPGTGLGLYSTLAACNTACPPPPPSWDCVWQGAPNLTYSCVDPGNGTGQYSSLSACQSACPPDSWDCVGQGTPGNLTYSCVDPGNGTGQYSSLSACQSACPPDSWDCVGGTNCQDPGTGYGQYSSLAACNANCPIDSWDCSGAPNWICSDPGTGLAQYSTLSSCQNDCYAPSWNCLGPGNCVDPGNGSGTHSTLAACNVACPALSWDCVSPGNCQDPGNGTGAYSTLAACNTDCPPLPPSWDCTNPGTSSNCHDPGTGLGQYSTLAACQNSCITPMPVSSGACGCNF